MTLDFSAAASEEGHLLPRSRRPQFVGLGLGNVGAVALIALSAALWHASLRKIHPAHAGDYGLVGQLPHIWWGALAVVVVGLLVASRASTRQDEWSTTCVLALGTAALALILHGTASASEPVARFPVAYLHAGFTDYIAQTGHTLPHLDARMSWPGFFAGAAVVARAMNVDPLWFAKWAPLILNLAYLLPLKVIADANLRSTRARWSALWIFLAANWIGQDYFSPQGLNLFLYLTVVAVVCRVFGASGPGWRPAQRAFDSRPVLAIRRIASRAVRVAPDAWPTEAAQLDTTAGTRLLLYLFLLLVVFASVASHQFTPVMIAIMATALALTGRTRLTSLWFVCAISIFAWLSFAAVTYWLGHLSIVFGGVGNVGGTLNQNVAVRLHGSAARLIVIRARIGFAALVWFAAALALLLGLRRGRSNWTVVALFLCPFAAIVGLSYGGEAIQRVYLFTLAPACVLLGSLIDHRSDRRSSSRRSSRLASCLWMATLVACLALFPIARWGNERFEAVSSGDLAAVRWVYANVPPGAALVAADTSIPWRYEHIADYRYVRSIGLLFDLSPSDLHQAFQDLGRNTYLVLTRDQGNLGSAAYGVPRDWLDRISTALAGNDRFRIVYRNPDAIVARVLVGTGA